MLILVGQVSKTKLQVNLVSPIHIHTLVRFNMWIKVVFYIGGDEFSGDVNNKDGHNNETIDSAMAYRASKT